MNKAPIFLLLAACFALSACGGSGTGNDQASAPPLAGSSIGGSFALTTQDGATLRWDDLKGKYRIVYFGYTSCPDVCPLDLTKIMAAYRLFAKAAPARAAKLQPLFISVDPARDTPAILKAYVANFPPNLIGLTGTPDQIAAAAGQFKIFYEKQKERAPGDYDVNHQRTPFLFGPKGEPMVILATEADKTPQDVEQELDRWVR